MKNLFHHHVQKKLSCINTNCPESVAVSSVSRCTRHISLLLRLHPLHAAAASAAVAGFRKRKQECWIFFFFGGKKVWTSFSLWAHRRELQRGNMTVSNRVRASCCRLTGCCWCLWRWQSFPAAAVRVKLNSWTTTTSWSVVQCLGDMTCVYENNYLKTEKVGRVGRGKHNVFPTVCVLVCVSACGAVSCWQTCRESLGVNYIINVCLMLDK